MPKKADEIKTNSDVEQSLSPEENTIIQQQNEISDLKDRYGAIFDRLQRLEEVQSTNKLRKWDEAHDPDSLRHLGRIPSFDGIDPIISLVRAGDVRLDEHNIVTDRQVITVKTLSGEERKYTLMDFVSACTGNSIPCIVNDWEVLMKKISELNKKRDIFARANGKTAKVNTVELLQEIRKEEKEITINVTLSEDLGKSFTGKTIDIPWQEVFNATP